MTETTDGTELATEETGIAIVAAVSGGVTPGRGSTCRS